MIAFILGACVMVLIGMLACTAPALRALRIMPTEALRDGGSCRAPVRITIAHVSSGYTLSPGAERAPVRSPRLPRRREAGSASAFANSCAEVNRSAGSFSNAFLIAASTLAGTDGSRTPDGNYAGPTWTPSTSSRLDCVRRRARNRPRTIERPNG